MKKLLRMFGKTKQTDFVTVVSGLPRSGTSMMMKMLEAGGIPPITDNLRTADPDNPKGYYEFERVKKLPDGDIAWVPDAVGKVVKVISALLMHLPVGYTYKVLFMRRAMPEILASQRKMLVRRGEDPNKVNDEEMMRLYEKHLARVFQWVQEQPNVSLLEVDYNQMLTDPLAQIPGVAAFLQGKVDPEKMAAMVDPNLYRNRDRKVEAAGG